MPLSPRLQGLLDMTPEKGMVADVGSDHGRLALAIAARGQAVIATERDPLRAAALRRDLERRSPGHSVQTRHGDGLEALTAGEVETIVIAGLGGRNILAMLDRATWLPPNLVLQPARDATMVGAWIERRRWPARSALFHERGRAYPAWRVTIPAAVALIKTAATV